MNLITIWTFADLTPRADVDMPSDDELRDEAIAACLLDPEYGPELAEALRYGDADDADWVLREWGESLVPEDVKHMRAA